MNWYEGVLPVFDVESTGTDPRNDRIVEAALMFVNPDGSVDRGRSIHTLVNPGIPIPAGASGVHGITDEEVQHRGMAPYRALSWLYERIYQSCVVDNLPLVIFNAPYDMTMFLSECERHSFDPAALEPIRRIHLFDPLVVDRHFEKYRRGGHKLENVAAMFRVVNDAAHSADADAITTAAIVRKQAERYAAIRTTPLDELQRLQAQWFESWRVNINAYWTRRGIDSHIDASEKWPFSDDVKAASA